MSKNNKYSVINIYFNFIGAAISNKLIQTSEVEVNSEIKIYLRQACDRNGGRLRRKPSAATGG